MSRRQRGRDVRKYVIGGGGGPTWTFIGVGPAVSGVSPITVTLPSESVVLNDMMFCLVANRGTTGETPVLSAASAALGWQDPGLTLASATTSSGARMTPFYRRCTGTGDDLTAPTIEGPLNSSLSACCAVGGLVTTGSPIQASHGTFTSTGTTTLTFNGAAAGAADEMILGAASLGHIDTTTAQLSGSLTNADLEDIVTRINANTDLGGGTGLVIFSANRALAATFGQTTGTLLNSQHVASLCMRMTSA